MLAFGCCFGRSVCLPAVSGNSDSEEGLGEGKRWLLSCEQDLHLLTLLLRLYQGARQTAVPLPCLAWRASRCASIEAETGTASVQSPRDHMSHVARAQSHSKQRPLCLYGLWSMTVFLRGPLCQCHPRLVMCKRLACSTASAPSATAHAAPCSTSSPSKSPGDAASSMAPLQSHDPGRRNHTHCTFSFRHQ